MSAHHYQWVHIKHQKRHAIHPCGLLLSVSTVVSGTVRPSCVCNEQALGFGSYHSVASVVCIVQALDRPCIPTGPQYITLLMKYGHVNAMKAWPRQWVLHAGVPSTAGAAHHSQCAAGPVHASVAPLQSCVSCHSGKHNMHAHKLGTQASHPWHEPCIYAYMQNSMYVLCVYSIHNMCSV